MGHAGSSGQGTVDTRYYTARPPVSARMVVSIVVAFLLLAAAASLREGAFSTTAVCVALAVFSWAKIMRERMELWHSGIRLFPAWSRSTKYGYDQVDAIRGHRDCFEIRFKDKNAFRVYSIHGNPRYVKDILEEENPGLRASSQRAVDR